MTHIEKDKVFVIDFSLESYKKNLLNSHKVERVEEKLKEENKIKFKEKERSMIFKKAQSLDRSFKI